MSELARRTVRPTALLLGMLYALVLLYLVLPVLIVIPLSFSSSRYLQFPPPGWSLEWYRVLLRDPQWVAATRNSVLLGLAVAPLATVVGTFAALGLVRSRFRGRALLLAFFVSPMIVPSIVLAIAVYALYTRLGLVGSAAGVILAHTVLAVPLVIVNVAATLQRFDFTLERAAQSLGANRLQSLVRVVLPNIWPGILSGALFAFITSFDELVIVLFVSGRMVTIPRKIWEDLIVLIEPTQAAASTVLIAVSLLVFGAFALLSPRR